MQTMNQDLGFPNQDDTTQSRNLAAIALAEAMNRVRTQQSKHDSAKMDNRAEAVSRLEALRKKLAPLYSAIPDDVEMFDLGLVSHEKPRLFVDILAFIELNRDQTGYCFLQETRAGRIMLAQTDDEKQLVAAVTDYVARRLIEREQALSEYGSLTQINSDRATTASASSHAYSTASTTHSEPDLTHSVVAPAHHEAFLKRDIVPAITAAEAFRQWSPSALPTTEHTAPMSQVERLVNAHNGAAATTGNTMPNLALPSMQTIQDNLPSGVAKHIVSEKAAAVAHAVAETPTTVTAGVDRAANLALHSPVVVEQSVAALVAQTSPINALKVDAIPKAALATGVAASAGVVAAAKTTVATRKNDGMWMTGWWIWPLLALLLGIGLGAFMLYVYAANLVR